MQPRRDCHRPKLWLFANEVAEHGPLHQHDDVTRLGREGVAKPGQYRAEDLRSEGIEEIDDEMAGREVEGRGVGVDGTAISGNVARDGGMSARWPRLLRATGGRIRRR